MYNETDFVHTLFSEKRKKEFFMKKQHHISKKIILALAVFVTLIHIGAGCTSSIKDDKAEQKQMPTRDINDVLKDHEKEMMSLSGVVGIYIGAQENGALCIRVMLKEKSAELEQKIPKTLEGYPVEIEVTGEIKPLR